MNSVYYGLAALIILVITGCRENVKRQIQSTEVTINDSNKLSVSDSIYFISTNTLPNKITLLSDVPDGNLYYSVNHGQFKLSSNQSITLPKQDSILQYYFAKKDFDNSVVKTVMFPKHAKRFLDKISLNSSILDSPLNIKVIDKSRGVIMIALYNINGASLIQRGHFKDNDELLITYALDNYPPGMYILTISYGKNLKAFQLLKP